MLIGVKSRDLARRLVPVYQRKLSGAEYNVFLEVVLPDSLHGALITQTGN